MLLDLLGREFVLGSKRQENIFVFFQAAGAGSAPSCDTGVQLRRPEQG